MKQKYLYTTFALIPVIIGMIGLFTLLRSPYTGLHFEYKNDKWYISSIDPNSPASKYPELKEKEIAAIANTPIGKYGLQKEFEDMSSWADLQSYWVAKRDIEKNIKIASPLTITIKEGDKLAVVSIVPANFPLLSAFFNPGIAIIIGLIVIFLGLSSIFKKSYQLSTQLFVSAAMFIGTLYLISRSLITSYDIAFATSLLQFIYVSYGFASFFATALLLHFVMIFPRASGLSKNKAVLTSIYVVALVSFIISITSIYNVYYLYTLLYLAITVGILIYNYITIDSVTERAQVRLVVWGLGSFLLIGSVFFYIPVLITGHPIIHQGVIIPLGLVIITLSLVAAIKKYRLMDVDTLFDNTLIYSITVGLLVIIDMGVGTLFSSRYIPILDLSEPVPTIIAVLLIVFAYIPVRNGVRDMIKRLLKREIYDINKVIMRVSEDFVAVNDTDTAITKAKKTIMDTLHPQKAAIYLYDDKGRVISFDGPGIYIKPDDLSSEIFTLKSRSDNLLPDGSIVLPLRTMAKNIGYILLYPKYSGNAYDRNDHNLLSIIANLTASTIERVYFCQEIKDKDIQAVTEKHRISREIHDGLGHSFLNAMLLSQTLSGKKDTLLQLRSVLHEGLTDLRELVWAIETDDKYTLYDLIGYLNARIQFFDNYSDTIRYSLKTDIKDSEGIPVLSYEQKTNIIRIIQEAISNIFKYSKASNVTITVSYNDDLLEIRITDDGKGFNMDKQYAGYGIRNMKERADSIGAKLLIVSEPAKGTEIVFSLLLGE